MPGSPSYLRPGTPALAKFLIDLGYNTGQFGKNHLGDHTAALPTAHGFQEHWGYLYHLDAMQGVSFPDINKSLPPRSSRRLVRTHRSPASRKCRALPLDAKRKPQAVYTPGVSWSCCLTFGF
jgi:arylsulfatase A-like enzyme